MEKQKVSLQQIKNKLLRMLTKRDYSTYEMQQKLKLYYQFDQKDFEEAILWLKELKYLPNENDLAKRLSTQWRKQGRGRKWISGKLATKGLKDATLKDDSSEIEAAQSFIEKKTKHVDLSTLSFNEKMALKRKMLARGFSITVISKIIR